VNVVEIPVAVAKDALTLGGTLTDQNSCGTGQSYTREQIEKLKEEADD
jgi:hypothetical protein